MYLNIELLRPISTLRSVTENTRVADIVIWGRFKEISICLRTVGFQNGVRVNVLLLQLAEGSLDLLVN